MLSCGMHDHSCCSPRDLSLVPLDGKYPIVNTYQTPIEQNAFVRDYETDVQDLKTAHGWMNWYPMHDDCVVQWMWRQTCHDETEMVMTMGHELSNCSLAKACDPDAIRNHVLCNDGGGGGGVCEPFRSHCFEVRIDDWM